MEGTETWESLAEMMADYCTKPLGVQEIKHLETIWNAPDISIEAKNTWNAPDTSVEKTESVKSLSGSKLNADAAEFNPCYLKSTVLNEGREFTLEEIFEEGLLGEKQPIEFLKETFPDIDLLELKQLFEANNKSIGWTLRVLMSYKDGMKSVGSFEGFLGDMESDMGSFPEEDLDEAFPPLPGQTIPALHHPIANGTSFLEIAKKKRPPAVDKPLSNSQESCFLSRKVSFDDDTPIPWVETGEAVAREYARLRKEASVYAKQRNACFCNVCNFDSALDFCVLLGDECFFERE